MANSLPDRSDGPERFRGGPKCPDHHAGTRDGITDWCCCCNPCLYERPPIMLNDGHCCKCVPIAICCTFTPNDGGDFCCRAITQTLFVQHFRAAGQEYSSYTGGFTGAMFEFRIGQHEGSGCYWRVISDELSIDELIYVDHTTVTCLNAPPMVIDNFTLESGCVGTISFGPYIADKVPFQNRHLELIEEPVDADIGDLSPCDCATAAEFLCVYGRRHVDGPVEPVEFRWNETLKDRWEYLPDCGSPTTDREIIFLRGDSYGNCYLELDFEQSGPNSNDWAEPPNTLGVDPHEVRDGMIPIDACGCGLKVYSTTTGERWVDIHAGPCGRWKYRCATCRCTPSAICVIGEIDGVQIQERMIWDGDGWAYDSSGGTYPTSFRLLLVSDECGDCVATAEGTFVTPFGNSNAIHCGPYVAFEIESEHDPAYPDRFNWIWAQSGVCGCNPSTCASCAEERCGGPPLTLYVELQGRTLADPLVDPTQPYDIHCDLTVAIHYWQRWSEGVPRTQTCGWIGFANISCGSTTYRLRVELAEAGSKLRVSRLNLNTGVTTTDVLNNTGVVPSSCDPYYYDRAWTANTSNDTPADICFWGCVQVRQVKVTIVE